ncbi:hypothetical protein BOTBODRAFT_191510 [Botryobasidium botryosum FD-172 SS1]|uniref:PX domain-containing protein n=1 Tax=Botryobasidium botryosum (strain FD-172 SS1) TaxID=930990 RepID=A0A067M2H8_BOTB1|nr:hypothetical protein BOTBODRAFT_191510 [Botryobasidium botryosum FD-172 SS1]
MYDPLSSPFAAPAPASPWASMPSTPAPAPRKPSPIPPPTPEKSPNPNLYPRLEPQVFSQPSPGLASPRIPGNATADENFGRPDPFMRIRLTALDRNRRDILIRFDVQTNLFNFTSSIYRNVSRSYVECQRFAEQLIYSNPQTIIPALPLPQTSAATDEEDDRLVRVMLQRWFTRICEDPILLKEEELRSFIESDFGYQPTVRARRKAGSGFSLLRRGPPDEDHDLITARFELTRLETQFFETAKAVDKLSRARRTVSAAHVEMGNKLLNAATTEANLPLAAALRKVGRTWQTLGEIDLQQASSESVIIGDSLGYQGINAKGAKETLLQRVQVLEEYQTAVKNTITKRRQIERLKASTSIRPDKVDEALEDLEEAGKTETHLAKRVEGMSVNLHKALATHSRQTHEDITHALIEHARSSILYERQILRELEALKPDVAAIDPDVKRSAMPASTINAASYHAHAPAYASRAPSLDSGGRPAIPTSASTSALPSNGSASGMGAGTGSDNHASSSSADTSPLTSPRMGNASASRAGRAMDGTQSAFVTPSFGSHPLALGGGGGNNPLAASSTPQFGTPGLPGMAGMGPNARHNRINSLARSVQVENARPRLDAREAASKLANFL